MIRKRRTIVKRIVAGLFISLDGVTESPNQWQFEHFDDGVMADVASKVVAEDTILGPVSRMPAIPELSSGGER
jgi:hypothetical protein